MVIATGDGQVFKDKFDMVASTFPNPFEDVGKYTPSPAGRGPIKPEPDPALKFWEHPSPKRIPIREGENEGREQVPLYRGGKDVSKPTPPREPIQTTPPGGPRSIHTDNEHHVPLLASAIMDGHGNMNGLAIDHRVKLSPQDEELVRLHEATELPYMNDLIRGGMKPSEAYGEAHAWATARETAASIARWGEDGHEAYKQRMRDAAAIASQPSDRDRHPDAHTTRYGLDESELGGEYKTAQDLPLKAPWSGVEYGGVDFGSEFEQAKKLQGQADKYITGRTSSPSARYKDEPSDRERLRKELDPTKNPLQNMQRKIIEDPEGSQREHLKPRGVQVAENITPEHPPIQIDVLGSGAGVHSGPGMGKPLGEAMGKPANENVGPPKNDREAMEQLSKNNPDLYKYFRAMWKQKGGEDWDRWQDIEEDLGITPQEIKPLPRFRTIKGGKE